MENESVDMKIHRYCAYSLGRKVFVYLFCDPIEENLYSRKKHDIFIFTDSSKSMKKVFLDSILIFGVNHQYISDLKPCTLHDWSSLLLRHCQML